MSRTPTTSGDAVLDAINEQRFGDAYRLARAGAENGEPNAQLHLGWLFEFGKGVDRNLMEAERWCRQAAGSHSPRAEFYLASLLFRRQDYAPARDWFERAAAQGFAPALYQLAVMYRHGFGVDADHTRGTDYLRRAADLGNLLAKRDLIRDMVKGKQGILLIPLGLVRLCVLLWSLVRVLARDEHDDAVLRV